MDLGSRALWSAGKIQSAASSTLVASAANFRLNTEILERRAKGSDLIKHILWGEAKDLTKLTAAVS
jgi:hypothetical protein